ncbi:MAG: hypothetical protein Q8M06_04325 [Methanobacteriaceae archaeon]|nr:hypothetical protein [Methanobacteriaceae archaeon]
MEYNKNNFLFAGLFMIIGVYSIYTKTYYSALGWVLLAFAIIFGMYMTKINAEKKYFIMVTILPVLALICFALEIFY